MPNIIPQYSAPQGLAIHPSETGIDALAQAARRQGTFASQSASAEETLARETERLAGQTQQLGRETSELGSKVGSEMTDVGRRVGSAITDAGDAAVKYLDNEQISKGAKDFSSLMLSSTQAWNATVKNADPNDPTVAAKFMAGMQPQLDQFKSGFYTEEGQKWAEAHTDALRQHLQEKTVGDMASLAGEAAVVNHQQTINQLSATVHGDPSSIDFALAALKSSTEGIIASNPNLTGAKANEVRTELLQKGSESIVKAAAIGYIDKTAKMPDWATDPKYAPYINGAELQMFEKSAQAQAKVNALTEKQDALATRQINVGKAHDAANKLLTDGVKLDPTSGRPIISPDFFKGALSIAKMPNAEPGLARTLIDWGEHQQNEKAAAVVSDPATLNRLDDGLFNPEKPTTRVDLMRAQVEGKLSDHDFQARERLVSELEQSPLKGPVYQTAMSAAKDSLIVNVPGIPGKDTVGAQNYSSFVQSFIPQYLAKSRAGALPANALDTKDPNSMISQSMAPFKRSSSQRMSDYVAGAGGLGGGGDTSTAPAPRVDGAEVPVPLRGIASLQRNKATGQFRDQTTGKIYDAKGNEVGR